MIVLGLLDESSAHSALQISSRPYRPDYCLHAPATLGTDRACSICSTTTSSSSSSSSSSSDRLWRAANRLTISALAVESAGAVTFTAHSPRSMRRRDWSPHPTIHQRDRSGTLLLLLLLAPEV
jgi:hypothetical protein